MSGATEAIGMACAPPGSGLRQRRQAVIGHKSYYVLNSW